MVSSRQRQQPVADRRRVGQQQRRGADQRDPRQRRVMIPHGRAQGAPQHDLIGAGQARVVDAVRLGRPAGEHRGNRGQADDIGRSRLARIVRRGKLQQCFGFGVHAEADHGDRPPHAAWVRARGSAPRLHRRSAVDSCRSNRSGGRSGKVEAAGQGGDIAGHLRVARATPPADPGTVVSDEAVRHGTQRHRVGQRGDDDALRGRQQSELRRAAQA